MVKRGVCLVACLVAAVLSAAAVTSRAQSTPFLSDDEIRLLINEISGDRAYEHIRWLTHWHRSSGSEGYFKAAEYILQAAKDAGLEDVRMIMQPLERPAYKAIRGELWMVEPVEYKLADIGDCTLYLADSSADADVTAELVFIPEGSQAGPEGLDLKGKIVLTNASPYSPAVNDTLKQGAVGLVLYPWSERAPFDYPDQIPWSRVRRSLGDRPGTFAFSLPARKGDTLRRLLATEGEQDLFGTGKRTPGGRVVLRAIVDTETGSENAETCMIEGWIRGSKYHDQQIVLTSHIQEEQTSANDDASGCANMLEFARVMNKLIAEGKVERPLRDIRFWWADEISSEYQYFTDHPESPRQMLANINQDMVGAKQSLGSRVQHLIYAPHSRTSFLDTLLFGVGTFTIQTNNMYLPAQRDETTGFKRRIYSARGTREGYNAALVPYFDSSDHMCFVEGIIGVPAVGLVNWDDDFIHSSGDDLFNIDQTQLARNNFVVSSMAFYMAYAEPGDVFLLASETFAHGCRRLANDLAVANRLLSVGPGGWKDAVMMVETGVARELRALESIRVFADGNEAGNGIVDDCLERMRGREAGMKSMLASAFERLHGSKPGEIALTEAEAAAAKKVPANIDDLATYFQKRRGDYFGRRDGGLHSLMRAETYYFVDGRRSYYDIYRAVRAEAMAAGEWYYGTVKLEDVVAVLDAAVESGALTLK